MIKTLPLFAALALTACSINVDSQYGIRLEPRRIIRTEPETLKSRESACPEEYVASIEHPDYAPNELTAQPEST